MAHQHPDTMGFYAFGDDIVDAPIVEVSAIVDGGAVRSSTRGAAVSTSSLPPDKPPKRPVSYRPSEAYRPSVGAQSEPHRTSVAASQHQSVAISDEELARRLQEEEMLSHHIAATQTVPAERGETSRPRKLLKQASSFAAWQLNKEKYGYCFGEAKWARFNWLMIIVCTIMFIVEMAYADWQFEPLTVNPVVGPSVAVLLELGAKRADLIVIQKQYYRLVAPMFLHGGVIHIVFNMIALANIGVPLEHDYGTLKIAYIYLTSGFMGILVSCIFLPTTVGVGASGAIFGLFGAAWADLIQNWSMYREQGMQNRMLCQLTFATVINLALGMLPYLDNYAHLGGLFNGIITGLTVLVQDRFNRFGEIKQKKTYQACLQIFAVALTPLSIFGALIAVFDQVNVDSCLWCIYLSCIPTPWWSCGPCANTDLNAGLYSNNNTVVFTCPAGGIAYQQFNSSVTVGASQVIDACECQCYATDCSSIN